MKLSRQSDYAIRAVIDLALQPSGALTDARSIAERQGVPAAYLAKVLQALARAGLVTTARGARGGVRLARPARGITLLEVVEAVEGPTLFTRCSLWPGECLPEGVCPLHPVLEGLRKAVQGYLSGVTVAELAQRQSAAHRLMAQGERLA